MSPIRAAAALAPYLRLVVLDNPQADLYQATVLALRLMVDTDERMAADLFEPVGYTGPYANSGWTGPAAAALRNRTRVSVVFGGTYDEFRAEAGLAVAS